MTLDEAIEHAEEVASSCEGQCSLDHKQLAEWLKELKICRSHNRGCKPKHISFLKMIPLSMLSNVKS